MQQTKSMSEENKVVFRVVCVFVLYLQNVVVSRMDHRCWCWFLMNFSLIIVLIAVSCGVKSTYLLFCCCAAQNSIFSIRSLVKYALNCQMPWFLFIYEIVTLTVGFILWK